MRLLFRQRLFSWFDSYDIYDENGQTLFTVQGKISWGHKLEIYDASGAYLGRVKEVVLTLLPRFEIYLGEEYAGDIKKELSFFRPRFALEYNGWQVEGDIWQWNYSVVDAQGQLVMTADKELFRMTDTYTIDVAREEDALISLMIVLAIDAAKCSTNN